MKSLTQVEVEEILRSLVTNWCQSGNKEAFRCANLLSTILGAGVVVRNDHEAEESREEATSPPEINAESDCDEINRSFCETLNKFWERLPWSVPKEFEKYVRDAKEVRLVGPKGLVKSNRLAVKVLVLAAGTTVPRHSEEANYELLNVISGRDMKVGFLADQWLEKKDFYLFPPTCPKTFTADPKCGSMIVSVRTGDDLDVQTTIRINDEATNVGTSYGDITAIGRGNVETYYDNMAEDYEKATLGWGWSVPQFLVEALVEHGNLASKHCKILDLGCGDGKVGKALAAKGFTSIAGVDISGGMLKNAAKRELYCDLQKADLLGPLPYEVDSFDCLLSAGVTTYLEPFVLKNWLRILRPGGVMCILHKEAVAQIWEVEQKKLELERKIKRTWQSENPIPYLPSLKIKGSEMAKIFIFEKL